MMCCNRELQAGCIRQRPLEGMPSKLRPAALVLCRVRRAVGQDKEGPGQQGSRPGPREGLEFFTAGRMVGRRTAMRAKAQEEVRPQPALSRVYTLY